MFTRFFYLLREMGVPVSPTSFLRLQKALSMGLVTSLDDFYSAARAILVKSERYFDLYDQVFAHHFEGAELKEPDEFEISEAAKIMLEEWLRDPDGLAAALGMDADSLKSLSPDELLQYFLDRLKEQTEAHHGGNRWIGTRGTSPVGHSGFHPGGMRVGGVSRNKSAVKVALDRRYHDYSLEGPLTQAQIGEAMKRLQNMVPVGPRDVVNIDETIYRTMKNAGEIEIIFDRSMKDRLKVLLLIDNGGWSMTPYVRTVQTLFDHARTQFKELQTYYFHNTVYRRIWKDPPRFDKPLEIGDLARFDPETRIIFVGDASMAPYELLGAHGAINIYEGSGAPSVKRLRFIRKTFRHSVWLNPKMPWEWPYTNTIGVIGEIFPMFELTVDGLERAVASLMGK